MLNLKNIFWNRESEPYSKGFNRDSLSKLVIKGSIMEVKGCHGNFVFHWEGMGNARKKWLIVRFQYHSYTWVLHSLWAYDRI